MTTRGGVIIPAYNEGERVLPVAEAALGSSRIDEVIVVNDGSTDQTEDILSEIDGITVLTHGANRGKGEALDTGVNHARRNGHQNLVFLDADLQGINSSHIETLLAPLEDEAVPMTIGYLGLRKAIVKKAILNQWGALSGQRAIREDVWDLLSFTDKHGFNVEAALNARIRKEGMHTEVTRVELDGLGHVGKRDKEDTLASALRAYSRTYGSALMTYLRIELEKH